MTSILKVDTIQDQSGNNIINENADTITIGASGDTISIPSGATIDASGATLTLPTTIEVDTIEPQSGTTLTLGASGDTITLGSGVISSGMGKFESQLLHVRDEKASDTEGGAASAATSHTRVLNTVVTNEITGASLASNQITLPSGTYFIMSRAPAFMVNQTKSILYNTTDSSNTVIGSSGYADVNGYDYFDCFIFGRFTIGATKVFEIRHYTNLARANNGLGVKTSLAGVIEVYTDVQIWKVA